ncbi:MAG: hypothetical protein LC808_24525 [Actinobacteria bacterium]|nr:hypothetical protein [Actinomycetota bacterium]
MTIISALAYYFGWKRTEYYWKQFGVDQRVLGYSPQDYFLRAIDAVFVPLVVLLLSVVTGLIIYDRLALGFGSNNATRTDRSRTYILRTFGSAIMVLAGTEVLGLVISPVSFGLGLVLVMASAPLRGVEERDSGVVDEGAANRRWVRNVAVTSIVATSFGAAFWMMSDCAVIVGRFRADRIVRGDLAALPGATVFSKERLELANGRIEAVPIGDDNSVYRFQYAPLRLLAYTNQRYFLLPADWRPVHDPLIILADREDVRVELTRALKPQ